MPTRKDRYGLEEVWATINRHWLWVALLLWLGVAASLLVSRWAGIHAFDLTDTDDNMRIMQVRALLHGQSWYDLRQYRLNPPLGANIHWSRLVDLPIAGLILLLRPFLGGAGAESWAAALAPLIPLCVAIIALCLIARRLIAPMAFALPIVALFFSTSGIVMFLPDRIDHHGWQLALLVVAMAGAADPKAWRGGLVMGAATAFSLAIGMELLIYLALLGVAAVLFWVDDPEERERLRAFALSAGGGTAVAYLLFASNDNRQALCDALTPVWLSDALLGGALLFVLAWLSPAQWTKRLALAAGAGIILGAFHALASPQCLHRLEGVPEAANQLWLSHVREARPVYRHGWRIALPYVALAVTGAVGWMLLIWTNRGDRKLLRRTLAAAAPSLVAGLLLLWQTRTGPASQVTATIGAAAIAWILLPILWRSKILPVSVLGTALVAVIAAGAATPMVLSYVPNAAASERDRQIGRANRLCWSMWGMAPIAALPRGRVMTFVDLGPRLITVTHHDAVTGPYHRNSEQIVDVMHFWRGSADEAHAIARKYRSDYVLSCPKSSSSTIFETEAPKGFYVQLQKGQVPGWLSPVALPPSSPFRMWRVVG
jgi:hypothetical protein